ncbi:RDD family protein [Sphaerisporangium dianthi]|uniref:RDD family protein n=1 Tax=Sphaerisporangium dianthi TaxID=1436120 RepID=A0ABV9CLZ0_9ACTN
MRSPGGEPPYGGPPDEPHEPHEGPPYEPPHRPHEGPPYRPHAGQPYGPQGDPSYGPGGGQPYGPQDGPLYGPGGGQPYGARPWEGYDQGGPPYGPWGAPLGGRWRRLFAGLVDILIVGVLTSPFSATVTERAADGSIEAVRTVNGVGVAVIWFLYFWLLTAFWNGQTLGKRLFRLRVVQFPTQEAVTAGQAAVREIVYGVFGVVCCLGVADLLWILFDGKKQALHDKAASTIVVDA